jgi:hypothetical protein
LTKKFLSFVIICFLVLRFFLLMFGNIPDLTSPTGTEPQLPGGVAVGSVVQVPGNGLVGKSSVVIVLEREGEGLATSESSQTSASCCELVWLEESLGITVCGSKIGSKQGMQRFCISSVVGETTLCGISTHSKSAKAKAEPLAWYITSILVLMQGIEDIYRTVQYRRKYDSLFDSI